MRKSLISLAFLSMFLALPAFAGRPRPATINVHGENRRITFCEATPEPTAILLMATGLGVVALAARKK